MIGAARYFPTRYFAPRYWPKLGASADPAPYAEPEFTITRLFPRTQTISRKFAQTQSVGRLHAGTVEVTSE